MHLPDGFRLERLAKAHPRKAFASGNAPVDDWLHAKALQNQDKHLSVTKVLLDDAGAVAGYYTLATGQVDFGDLPADVVDVVRQGDAGVELVLPGAEPAQGADMDPVPGRAEPLGHFAVRLPAAPGAMNQHVIRHRPLLSNRQRNGP